jgi:Protein of unknown function (DUF1064)
VRLTETQFRAFSGVSKYRNRACVIDGLRFPSRLEARCYEWLKARRDVIRDVAWFVRQVPFDLPGGIKYRADFLAVLVAGGVEVIDAKGMLTDVAKLKLRLMKSTHGIDVVLWRGGRA